MKDDAIYVDNIISKKSFYLDATHTEFTFCIYLNSSRHQFEMNVRLFFIIDDKFISMFNMFNFITSLKPCSYKWI